MNLHALLTKRNREKGPLRVGLIGAGKFGSMYLAQARSTAGIHLGRHRRPVPARAVEALRRTGWPDGQGAAASLADALAKGTTFITDDALAMIASPGLDVIIDATGNPSAGIAHVLACCRHRKPIVMVNVEADALAGPLLARRAAEAGIVYSLAYGDQPALICEHGGLGAGLRLHRGRRRQGDEIPPRLSPIDAGYGLEPLRLHPRNRWQQGDFNAKMFNSFLDGTKSAIEMAAVANATGLVPPEDGLRFPPWDDVTYDEGDAMVKFRREMEALFKKEWGI